MWFKQGQIEVECGVGCDCDDKRRLDIAIKLKSIVRYINESLYNHERDEITDDNTTNEINDDSLL